MCQSNLVSDVLDIKLYHGKSKVPDLMLWTTVVKYFEKSRK